MEKKILTCPLTGIEFELISLENQLVPLSKAVTHHPLKHYPLDIHMNERWEICIPYKYFEHIETVTPTEAGEILGVSRQRITQIMSDGVIDSHIVNNSPVLLLDDVMEYKESRQPGRPRKEG